MKVELAGVEERTGGEEVESSRGNFTLNSRYMRKPVKEGFFVFLGLEV